MPATPAGSPPQPTIGGHAGNMQHQHIIGTGTAVQQMNSGGAGVNIAGYNEATIRQKVAVQVAAPAS